MDAVAGHGGGEGLAVVVIAGQAVDRHGEALQQAPHAAIGASLAELGQIAGRQDHVGRRIGAGQRVDHRGQGGLGVDAAQARRRIVEQMTVGQLDEPHGVSFSAKLSLDEP